MARIKTEWAFREILGAEIISVTGGVLAGGLLSLLTGEFTMLPGFLIFLPGFLEMRGNISGSLAARLSSGLFVGALKPRGWNRVLQGNVIASLLLSLLASGALALLAAGFSGLAFGVWEMRIIPVAILAAALANIVEIPLTVLATFWLYRNGHDPNNVMGPYVTTTGDIISILALAVALVVL